MLTRGYLQHTGVTEPFERICYEANKKVMRELFVGEIRAFSNDLGQLAALDRQARDVPLAELTEAFVEVTACLPVYRTYIRDLHVEDGDRDYIERTIRVARERTPPDRASDEAFAFLRRLLLLEPAYYAEEHKPHMLSFIMRWQQFTGPVMAKGLEDTASYRYNALISLNDVGSDPLRIRPPVDLAGFHEFNRLRLERWRGGLNATSTHDTKRGEDARARINVLSELPHEWDEQFQCWTRINEPLRRKLGHAAVPSANEEFLIYQTLLGTWPHDDGDLEDYPDRVRQFLNKAAREAKLHTSWIRPDEAYEQALDGFVAALLEPGSEFLDRFLPFQRKLAFYGAVNGLAQVLLKIASPGVPDFYQGCELWNFSMVDPDNRRPVDYRRRIELLDQQQNRAPEDLAGMVAELARDPRQDAAKLYVVWKSLRFRRDHAALFEEGEYIPFAASGAHPECVVAFARRRGDEWALAVAPRWLTRLGCTPPRLDSWRWEDTALEPPAGAPAVWSNVFTGAEVGGLSLSAILHGFPVALLEGRP